MTEKQKEMIKHNNKCANSYCTIECTNYVDRCVNKYW